jgi:hypothetical protein
MFCLELYYLFEWQQIAGPTSGSMDDDEHSSDMTLSQVVFHFSQYFAQNLLLVGVHS